MIDHRDGYKQIKESVCRSCCTRLEKVKVTLGGTTILHNVNLHFHCGQFIVIIGPNGAGKSTLLKAIAGEIPYEGELKFHRFGKSEPIVPKIGYVPQKMPFDTHAPFSVEDLFGLSLTKKPRWLFQDKTVKERASKALAAVRGEHLLKRRIGQLSGGELQRVMLSLALTPRPDILLLDEPLSGVDFSGLNLFYKMISELRTEHDLSIVMVSHDLAISTAYADRVVFLNGEKIVEGSGEAVFGSPEVREIFGTVSFPNAGNNSGTHHHRGEDNV
ncbi:metal ABC transporter ATP-binding protein [Chitinispirillales bacterium ANBcel5]|uniref:metal ABC transporter ATP-binding protein n=1 Tax=Cellulosispirillum alkaliphilum TaxID=3039283 RepID=UPI002A52A285|nr:metal ABC transporter ATP-binding protein [Chitinispirillales bacterium ANBcel5]